MTIRRASYRVRRNKIEKSKELAISIPERLYSQLAELSEQEQTPIAEIARQLIYRGLEHG